MFSTNVLFDIYITHLARFTVGLVLTLLAGVIGWWYAGKQLAAGDTYETWSQKNTVGRGTLLRIAFIGAVFLGLYQMQMHQHLFKWVEGYVQQSGLVIFKMLLVFLGAFTWRLPPDPVRLRIGLGISALSILIISCIELYLLWPMAAGLEKELLGKGGVVLQSTGFSCAPSSLATVCRLYGRRVGERDATLAVGAGMGGSFNDQIARGAQVLGFPDAEPVQTTLEAIASENLPLVISIKYLDVWDLHAVGLVGLSSTTIFLADPLTGIRRIAIASFPEIWRGNGVRLGKPAFQTSVTPRLSTFDPDTFQKLSWNLEPTKVQRNLRRTP
ncbi:MAG: cysteine peptidase family C39 domain-containing protein [Candidatus Ozemobacteraceae bacterium]